MQNNSYYVISSGGATPGRAGQVTLLKSLRPGCRPVWASEQAQDSDSIEFICAIQKLLCMWCVCI